MSDLIYERLAAVMADVPPIPKSQRNEQQRYAFRGIDDVMQALHGLFVKHEIVVLPEVVEAEYVQQQAGAKNNLATDARLRVRYTFITTDGSSVSIVTQGESRDYADKATNQAMSSGFKYGLFQMFMIPLEDDPDSRSPQIEPDTITEEEKQVRHENAVKAELVEVMGTSAAAADWWKLNAVLEPDEILKQAKEAMDGRKATEETAGVDTAPVGGDSGDDGGEQHLPI